MIAEALRAGSRRAANESSLHGVSPKPARRRRDRRAANFRLLRKAGEAASPDCPGARPGSHATSICPAPGAPILFTAPGAFYAEGKRRVKVVLSSAVLENDAGSVSRIFKKGLDKYDQGQYFMTIVI